jgi:hypothetical protein
MGILHDWADEARALGERKFVARHQGFFLLSTEDAFELQTEESLRAMLQTEVVSAKSKSVVGRRNFQVRPVVKADDQQGGAITVGRWHACDIRFDHPSMSKLHAHLIPAGSRLTIVDLNSRNGTLLNGVPLEPQKPTPIAVHDRIQFAKVQTMVLDARELYKLLVTMT